MSERIEILHKNLTQHFAEHALSGSVLAVDDRPLHLDGAIGFDLWHTRFHPLSRASTHPPADQYYDQILLRLPKSHAYFDFLLVMLRTSLASGGTLYVYGLNDEGIKGAQTKLKDFFGSVKPVYIKNRGRIIAATSPASSPENDSDSAFSLERRVLLRDFCTLHTVTYRSKKYALHYYPGMFGSGVLDEGTAFLLDHSLASVKPQMQILDYASGSGIIGKVILDTFPDTSVDLLDNDTLSIVAARQNVPRADSFYLGDTLAACPDDIQYDLIISNPPIHNEKQEQLFTVQSLIGDAHHVLADDGRLLLVAQARLDLAPFFAVDFHKYRILAETTRFKVWEAKEPRK